MKLQISHPQPHSKPTHAAHTYPAAPASTLPITPPSVSIIIYHESYFTQIKKLFLKEVPIIIYTNLPFVYAPFKRPALERSMSPYATHPSLHALTHLLTETRIDVDRLLHTYYMQELILRIGSQFMKTFTDRYFCLLSLVVVV